MLLESTLSGRFGVSREALQHLAAQNASAAADKDTDELTMDKTGDVTFLNEADTQLIRSCVLWDKSIQEEDELLAEDTVFDECEDMLIEFGDEVDAARDATDANTARDAANDDAAGGAARASEMMSRMDAKQLIVKLLARNKRKKRREAKAEADVQRKLGRKRVERDDTILKRYPDIGDKIESILVDMDVGADAHRHTKSLIINTARKNKKGNGFMRVKIELRKRFNINISYESVRRLGEARRSRSRVAARYSSVVAMKCRRSVKRVGRENIDDHMQNAKFRTLHYLRDRSSRELAAWFERDDHSKIRARETAAARPPAARPTPPSRALRRAQMNSSATTNQHATVTDKKGLGATHHDFMDEHGSPLYATTIRSAAMNDDKEINLAVVKADKLTKSTPTQHMADFYMLEDITDNGDVKRLFKTSEGEPKPIVVLEGEYAHGAVFSWGEICDLDRARHRAFRTSGSGWRQRRKPEVPRDPLSAGGAGARRARQQTRPEKDGGRADARGERHVQAGGRACQRRRDYRSGRVSSINGSVR